MDKVPLYRTSRQLFGVVAGLNPVRNAAETRKISASLSRGQPSPSGSERQRVISQGLARPAGTREEWRGRFGNAAAGEHSTAVQWKWGSDPWYGAKLAGLFPGSEGRVAGAWKKTKFSATINQERGNESKRTKRMRRTNRTGEATGKSEDGEERKQNGNE
jgi:hypothetical protein